MVIITTLASSTSVEVGGADTSVADVTTVSDAFECGLSETVCHVMRSHVM